MDLTPKPVQVYDLPPPGETPQAPLYDPPAQAPQENLNSDSQTKMTSTLAAFATKMNASSDVEMQATQQDLEEKIKLGKEEEVRSQVAEQYRNQQVQALQGLQSNALKVRPEDYTLGDAMAAEQDVRNGPANTSAVEENGTKVMQVAGQSGDGNALRAYLQAGQQVQSDFAAKTAVLNSQLDKLKTEAENESPLEKFADVAFGFTGLEDLLVGSHFIKGQGTFFRDYASNLNKQSNYLWSRNPQEFGDLVSQAIDHGKTFWGAGPTYKMLKQIAGPNVGLVGQSALSYNFWTYAGPLSYVPVMKMAKYASGLARVTGNRALSTNIAASGIAAASLGVPSGLEHVQPIEASIAETIPSVSIPDTVSLARGDVGMVSDVADRIAALNKATADVRATMQKTSRLEPAQAREAIDRAVKEAENTYRDSPVADIKRADPVDLSNLGKSIESGTAAQAVSDVGKPGKAPKEFVGVSNKSPLSPTQELAKRVRDLHADMVEMRSLNGGSLAPEHIAQYKNDLAELSDEYGILSGLNTEGELRPMKPGVIKRTGQSKTTFEIDNDTDVDTLSHFNARGEIYHDVPPDKTFRTNPMSIQTEHDLEVARLEAEGSQTAAGHVPHAGSRMSETGLESEDVDFNRVENKSGLEFRVARKMPDGTIREGKKGQIHFDLIDEHEDGADIRDEQMGFVDQNGKFYSRSEAAAAIGRPGRLESVKHQEGVTQPFGKNPEIGNVGGIRSIPTVTQSPSTGLYSLSFYLGKDQTTGGFLTREGAEAAAERRGLANAQVHQTLSGEWYIKADHIVPESGLVTKAVKPEDFPAVYKPSEFVKSLDGLMPMLHNEARKGAVVGRTRFINDVINPYAKNIRRLNPSETRLLSSVLKSGEGEKKWYAIWELFDKYQQLAGRLPTEKEQLAYYSTKEISDTVYHILNNKLYVAKARRGTVTATISNPEIGFDTGRVNAQIVHPDEARGQHIFVADDGSVSDGVRKDVQLLIDTGHYKMVKLEKSMMQEDKAVKFVLAHQDSIKVEPLERQQLEYSPGGSREYADKWFSKQANYVDDAEGHRTWLDPLTHTTGDYKSIKKWNDGMEQARQVFSDPSLSEAEKRLLIDRSPIESYDKFEEMVNKGLIHPNTPFETLFDKVDPAAMKRIGVNDKNLTDPMLSGEESYYMTQARMYYGEKGERLRNPSGMIAKTLDPLATLRRAVLTASKTNALADYNTKVIEDWAKAASKYIDHNTVGNEAEPWDLFFNGKFLDKGLSLEEQRLVSGMDISRNAHKRFMNMRDPEQNLKTQYLKNLAIKLETKGRISGNTAQAIYNRLSDDPVSVARDLVFQGYFGFMNLRRFVLHASQAVGAIAYDPVRGLTAAGMAPLTASAVWINRSDKWLDYIARKMGPDIGMGVQDYKQMVQSLRYSGWLHVGGEVAQLDRYSDKWGGSYLSKAWDATKKVGIAPFHAAIATQRLMAYHIAWSEAKELMPAENVWSSRFQGYVNNKADALSGNMTTASSAAWQKGVWSIPTQFMSWQARMMENLLPETFGGSKALSGQQKLRYAIGQSIMWGAAGVPLVGAGVDWLSDMYRENTGEQIGADTHRAITRGLMDSIIHGFTGVDTDLAGSAGFGSAINKTLEGFHSGTMNPFLQMLGGPVYETGNVAIDKIGHFVNYMKAEQSDDISIDQFNMAFRDAVPLIQGLKFYQKAYWAYKYGNIFDQKTGQPILMNGTTTADVVTQALGIPNIWETAPIEFLQKQDQREQTINDVAQQVAKIRREEFDAIAKGDTSRMTHMSNIVRVLMQPYRDQPLLSQEIAKRSSQYMTKEYTASKQEQTINREYKNTGFVPPEANQ